MFNAIAQLTSFETYIQQTASCPNIAIRGKNYLLNLRIFPASNKDYEDYESSTQSVFDEDSYMEIYEKIYQEKNREIVESDSTDNESLMSNNEDVNKTFDI